MSQAALNLDFDVGAYPFRKAGGHFSGKCASPFDSLMEITSRPPIVFVEGRGSWLRDASGKQYLDFIQGWAVNCLGHCPDAITRAIAAQAGKLLNCSPSFYNAPMVRLADLIAQASGLHKTFFTNSGAEAIEGAIKLARKWGKQHRGGAYEIITMDHGFHGRTLAAMAASGKQQWEQLFEPKVPGFKKVPLNDLAAVEAAITPNTVAVMLEPIQGEAGVFVASDEFLQGLRALTARTGILLILDEIQTGIGRTGKFFGFEHAGVAPDIMTLGKGLGGGIPLGALVAHEAVCCFEHGDQGGTFNGNAFATAVGCAVMEEIGQSRLPAAGDADRHLPDRPPREAVAQARLRRRARQGPAARARPQAQHRPRGRGRGARARRADQRAAAGLAALHAGAQRDARRDRSDDRRAGRGAGEGR